MILPLCRSYTCWKTQFTLKAIFRYVPKVNCNQIWTSNCVLGNHCCSISTSTLNSSEQRLEMVKLAYDSYQFTKDIQCAVPIIIIHGLLGSKGNWRSLSKDIARKTGRKIYAVDARNHGESPHSENFDYYHMAADIESFLDEMKIDKALLVGHSMGGRIAMLVAVNKPELVDKLVVVDVSPVTTADAIDSEITTYMEAMQSSLQQLLPETSLSVARKIVDKHLIPAVPNIATRQFLLTNLSEINGEIKWRCNLDVLLNKFANIKEYPLVSKEYHEPTLFMCGEQSLYVPKHHHERIRQIFPKARFIYFEGAGHWVHSEKPTEFTKVLIEFIQD